MKKNMMRGTNVFDGSTAITMIASVVTAQEETTAVMVVDVYKYIGAEGTGLCGIGTDTARARPVPPLWAW